MSMPYFLSDIAVVVFGMLFGLNPKIMTRIDNFLNSRAEYVKYNKNYKLVFLLIGPSGTEKSTLCKLIAQYTKKNMDATITDNSEFIIN